MVAVSLVLQLAAVVAGSMVGGALGGNRGAGYLAVVGVAALLWGWLGLPPRAHRAFVAGHWKVAARRYRWAMRLAPTPARRHACRLSWAWAEAIASGQVPTGPSVPGDVSAAGLVEALLVDVNNRALAASRGPDPTSLPAWLIQLDTLVRLRPELPALWHTRARLLIALQRPQEAVEQLERMRAAGPLSDTAEAARASSLADAWAALGEAAYAEDYRARAAGRAIGELPLP